MLIRTITEAKEQRLLAPWAAKSVNAQRTTAETPCNIRTAFQRDRDRIIHSTAFRKLKHKTQVYLCPGDHYRTRLTHSMEVSQIARTIAGALELNENLTEAAALGHDIGHTPFGHAGEHAMNAFTGHFKHNEQSLRVVELYGRNGRGLNLTAEVRDAILCHTGKQLPTTLEGLIVRRCDRIAYLCHDFDDGRKVGLVGTKDLPGLVTMRLGSDPSQILDVLVNNIIEQSYGKPAIILDPYYEEAVEEFRAFMFDYIYCSVQMAKEHAKAEHVVQSLMELCLQKPELLPSEVWEQKEKFGLLLAVTDYIAGLTDASAVQMFQRYFVPLI
ncbi:MAG: deoxyguanosinetriphosphate triphosphohydrolase [Acidaminococcaceae bacterium]